MTGTVIHQTDRLLLKSWDLEDFDAFAPIARTPQVMHFIADGTPWPDSRIGWFMGLQRAFQHDLGYCCWKAIEKTSGELIGFCGLAPVFSLGETEIGWWLKPSHWHRGFATEAAQYVCAAAFEAHGLQRLIARADDRNAPSLRIIDRLGMKRVRTLDRNKVGSVVLFEKSALAGH